MPKFYLILATKYNIGGEWASAEDEGSARIEAKQMRKRNPDKIIKIKEFNGVRDIKID